MAEDVLARIKAIKDTLPKKQKRICEYLLANHEQIGVMTVAELADATQTGPATVMRLVRTAGYESYSTFKKDILRSSLVRSNTAYYRIKQSFSDETESADSHVLHDTVTDGICVLENLCTSDNMNAFDRIIEKMLSADRVFCMGMRSTRAMAEYFCDQAGSFFQNIAMLGYNSEFIFDQIALRIGPGDLVVIFSVWPCTRASVDAAAYCAEKHVPIVLVTNTSANPIVSYADAVINVDCAGNLSGVTAFFIVIEALVSRLGQRFAPKSIENIEKVEKVLREKNIIL